MLQGISKMAFTSVNITVLDVNDNSPQFDQGVYDVYAPEDSPLDSVVFVAQVSQIFSSVSITGYSFVFWFMNFHIM